MRWLSTLVLVSVVVMAGCASKAKEKGPSVVSTTCSPDGGKYLNGTTVDVTLTASKTGAIIHYGIDDPSAGSTALDTVSFTVSGSDTIVTVYYWSEWTDPNTGVVEKENNGVPREAKFEFASDWIAPTVSITPSGGVFGDRADVNPITISASDTHSNVKLYYRTQEDGGGWSDWQEVGDFTAKTVQTTVNWADGVMVFEVEAYAEDELGNKSGTASERYEFDLSAMARKVMDLINQKREEQQIDPLEWDDGLAAACETHAEQLAIAIDNGGDPDKYSPGDPGADGKKLSDRTSYRFAFGAKGSQSAEDVFNLWWNSTHDNWSPTGGWGDPDGVPDMQQWMLSEQVTKFGCGFETKYWIWIAALR